MCNIYFKEAETVPHSQQKRIHRSRREFLEVPWHKKEKENILKAVGIKVEYGEPVEEAAYRQIRNSRGQGTCGNHTLLHRRVFEC